MTDFPVLRKDELAARQLELWDELTLGPRGFYTGGEQAVRLPDLYNAWLQFPGFCSVMLRLGDEIRACGDLPGKLRELIVLTTSARLGARVEFDFHVPFARNEGLGDPVISALAAGAVPGFADEREQAVYDANVELLETATLTPSTRDDIVRLLGHSGLIALIAVATLYIATAYTTNVARVKLAEDFSADPQMLKDFFAGKAIDPEADPGPPSRQQSSSRASDHEV